MPNRRKRLSPGQTYGGGGGGFDLGGLLMSIYGGIEANPDAQIAQQAQTAPLIRIGSSEEAALKSGAINQPFRAKTMFDRNEANRLNAAHVSSEMAADNDIIRALRQKESEIPLNARNAYETNTASFKAEREHKDALFPAERERTRLLDEDKAGIERGAKEHAARLAEETARKAQVLTVLQASGIPAIDAVKIADAASRIYEPSVQTALAKLDQGRGEAELATDEAGVKRDILGATSGDIKEKALTDASLAKALSAYRAGNNASIGIEEAVKQPMRMKEAGIIGALNTPVTDGGLFNQGTGKFSLLPKNPLEIGGNPLSRIPQNRPQGREIIPGVVDTQGEQTEQPVFNQNRAPIASQQEQFKVRPVEKTPLPQINDPLSNEFMNLTGKLIPYERTEARREVFRNLGNEVGMPPEYFGNSTVTKDMADTMRNYIIKHPELAEQFMEYPGRTNIFDTILRKYKLKP